MTHTKHGADVAKQAGRTGRALAALVVVCAGALGCGNPGTPQPPSLKLPDPVTDLNATRTGDTVQLHWTMTRRSTDKLLLKGDQQAVACRATAAGRCEPVCRLLLLPDAPASCDDVLPDALRSGTTRLLRYEVRLQNHRGKDAGPSNQAYAAAGFAPPRVKAVDAAVTAAGIRLRWDAPTPAEAQPAPGAHLFARIDRDRVLQPGESATAGKLEVQNGVPQPLEQMLQTPEHPPAMAGGAWTPDHTVDAQAELNRSYRYTVSLVEEVDLEGHPVSITGLSAHTGIVTATDVYPPAVPQELAAVANPDSHTIDLSWSADADQDLKGYFVYRRADRSGTEGSSDGWQRVSGDKPLATPAWSDSTAKPGVRYRYSVSAVDMSGNESARSTETEEGLPVKTVTGPIR